MAQLRQDIDRFIERDTVVLVIGPEDAKKFATYFAKNDLPFTGLPDPNHSVLKKYGQEIKLFKFGRMPAQALIDTFLRFGILSINAVLLCSGSQHP